MKKVFISVGMRGREDHEVVSDLERARQDVRKLFGDVEVIDNWNCEGPDGAGRTWHLGEAIKKLGDCDACYFVDGWQNHKGCLAELEICKIYGILIIKEGL